MGSILESNDALLSNTSTAMLYSLTSLLRSSSTAAVTYLRKCPRRLVAAKALLASILSTRANTSVLDTPAGRLVQRESSNGFIRRLDRSKNYLDAVADTNMTKAADPNCNLVQCQ